MKSIRSTTYTTPYTLYTRQFASGTNVTLAIQHPNTTDQL
jgi:hypothetical protein